MVDIQQLNDYIDDLLQLHQFKDYCPNGLQVAGSQKIKKIVTGVSANLALIQAAQTANADALLVHHGFFWKGENPCIVAIKRQRIAALIKNDINLLAYHLPLDAHPIYGNNAQLGQLLGFTFEHTLKAEPLVFCGHVTKTMTGTAVKEKITQVLQRAPLHIPATRPIKTVAWCSGGAQSMLEAVALTGIDAYITGEISEQITHIAQEYDIHFFAAGHHATESYGVQALGQHLAEHFNLEHQFIDIPNPV